MSDEPTPNLPAERPKSQIMTGAAVAGLIPQSLDEAYRLAKWCAESGLTPKGIDTPEKCLYVIMAGADLKMPPVQSLQSFALINNRLSIWGDAIPALLWSNGFKIREWFDGQDAAYPDSMTARCEITRPDGEVIPGEFSVADAKEARLWQKDGPWQTARKRMLKARARGFSARDGAADLLRGLYIAEEAQDMPPLLETEPTGTGMVARLNARAKSPDVDPAGFNVRTITAETDAAKPKKGKSKPAPEPEVIEAVVEEIAPEAAEAPQEAREPEVAQSDAPAENASPERPQEADGDDEGDVAPVIDGPAPAGVRYGLDGDEPDANDLWPVHVDGVETGRASSAEFFDEPIPIYTDHAPKAEPPPTPRPTRARTAGPARTSSDSAAPASPASPAPPESSPQPQEPQSSGGEDVTEGVAAPGDTYFLAGETWDDAGRRRTYRDGIAYSSAPRRRYDEGTVLVYAQHSPKVGADDDADAEGLAGASEAQDRLDAENLRKQPGPLDAAIPEFRAACTSAESWLQIKAALTRLRKVAAFLELPDDMQAAERVFAYQHGAALAAAGKDPVHVSDDPSFFVLWLDTAPGRREIEGAFAQLVRSPAYRSLKDEQKDLVAAARNRAMGDDL